ncbi:MAG: hypothetical protein V4488_20370 [Pseudomonadota bacterium]
MNPETGAGWNGLYLQPLPYESIASIMLRFAWRNALRSNRIKTIFRGEKLRNSKQGSLYCPNWVDVTYIAKNLGWRIDYVPEMNIGYRFGSIGLWASNHFRYCRFCLLASYHSYFYQYHLLNACPIHNSELIDRCLSCNDRTPLYYCNKELFEISYHCPKCGQPLTGDHPTITAYLRFQQRVPELETRMAELMRWCMEKKDAERLTYLNASCYIISPTMLSARQVFIRRQHTFFHSPPEFLAPQKSNSISILTVRCGAPYWNGRPRPYKDRWMGPYQCMIRRLERWIQQTEGKVNTGYMLTVGKELQSQSWSISVKHVAVAMFRYLFEGEQSFSFSRNPKKIDEPILFQNQKAEVVPGVVWLATYLTIFGWVYYWITHVEEQSIMLFLQDLNSLNLPYAYNYGERVNEFISSFPTVAGLSLSPFKTIVQIPANDD